MASQGCIAESDCNITGRHVQCSIHQTHFISLGQLWLIMQKYRAKCLWNTILGIRRFLESLAAKWYVSDLQSCIEGKVTEW